MKNDKLCFDKKVGVLFLVGTLFVLFAFASQGLLSQKQSTDSKAAQPKLKQKQTIQASGSNSFCTLSGPVGLSDTDADYYKGGDMCTDNTTTKSCMTGYKDSVITCNTGNSNTSCCRIGGNGGVFNLDDERCNRKYGSMADNIKCESSCSSGRVDLAGGVKANGCAIGNIASATLSQAMCCGKIKPTATPTPTPTPVTRNPNDCGTYHIDCPKTFNDSSIVCVGNDVKGWCAVAVAKGTDCSKNPKYAYPIKKTDGSQIQTPNCLKQIPETAVQATGLGGYYCSMTQMRVDTDANGTQIPITDTTARQKACKDKTAPKGHSND